MDDSSKTTQHSTRKPRAGTGGPDYVHVFDSFYRRIVRLMAKVLACSRWLPRRTRIWEGSSSIACLLLLAGIVVGVSASLFLSNAAAEAVARGYVSGDPSLRPGMAVSLIESAAGNAKSTVTGATRDKLDKVVGIATTVDNSLVTVGSSDAQIYVETDGAVDAYVSDVNGLPKKGDQLTISPVKGVLMLSPNASMAVAIAGADLDTATAETYNLEGSSPKTTKIGLVKVNLDAKGLGRAADNSTSPLASIGRTITGKDVSDVRVLVSLVVFLLVLLSEGSILYGAISSAMKSVGRNPLAKTAITKELVRVALIAVGVLVLGVGAVCALLWI